MEARKRKGLEAAGWRVGTAEDFLELDAAEAALVELKLGLSQAVRARRTGAGDHRNCPEISRYVHAFNRFRSLYNEERPHEFLGGRTPGSCYSASPQPYPERLPPLEYPGHFLVKRVTNAGTFRLKHKLLFIANALKQHHIGLDETDDGIWSIYSGTVLLGKVNERGMIIRD